MRKETIHALLPPATVRELKAAAKRQGLSFSELVRRLLTRSVQNKEHEKA